MEGAEGSPLGGCIVRRVHPLEVAQCGGFTPWRFHLVEVAALWWWFRDVYPLVVQEIKYVNLGEVMAYDCDTTF